jgi:RNA polymerase sigma-70 factor (ECF subfamily)
MQSGATRVQVSPALRRRGRPHHAGSSSEAISASGALKRPLYLAIACAARVEQAIIAFDKHYLSGLASALIRHGQDRAAAADVVQAVRVRFLVGDADRGPKVAEYNGRGSIAAWLRVAARHTAVTAFRKYHRETAIDDFAIVARSCNPDIALLGMQLGGELEAAFRSSFAALAPRERNLLRYQVLDRLGIDRIGALHGVHRVTAARWIAHARKALIEGVLRRHGRAHHSVRTAVAGSGQQRSVRGERLPERLVLLSQRHQLQWPQVAVFRL